MLDMLETARRRLRGEDAGVAMLSVLMLILILTTLGILVLGLALTQSKPTLYQEKNVRTLAAAQAGLDAAAFQIRNAYTSDGLETVGDIHKLPCSVSGSVDGDASGTSYQVEISYYKTDPEGRDDLWLEANALTCYPVAGSMGGVRDVPRFALLRSEGLDPTATANVDRADRVVEATYTFQLTTRKIVGGRIFDENSQYCWVADSASAGAFIRYRSFEDGDCDEATDLNSWTWANDYMLHLSSSDRNGAIPMCLTGRASDSDPTPMTLEPCTSSSADPLGQRFAWTQNYTWRGQNSANSVPIDSFIVNEDASADAGDRVSVSTSANWRSVNPDPAVGKGNASYDTDQVVNHLLFGRCLDVTDADINELYMITYPCKQDPSGGNNFQWNHKWYYDEPEGDEEFVETEIRVNTGSTWYCLISPSWTTRIREVGTGADIDVRTPRFKNPSNNRECGTTRTTWKRYGYHEDNALAYHIVDHNGLCLSSNGPRSSKETGHRLWNTVIVEACSDAESQMWNVPQDPVEASLNDFEETTGRGES